MEDHSIDQELMSVFERLHRLENAPFLPGVRILKDYVRTLQRDIKQIADTLKQHDKFVDALNLYKAGLDIDHYLDDTECDPNCANIRRLLLGHAECKLEIAKRVTDIREAATWYTAGITECKIVLMMDPQNIRAEVLPVTTLWDMITIRALDPPTEAKLIHQFALVKSLHDMLNKLSLQARNDSQIIAITTQIDFKYLPSRSTVRRKNLVRTGASAVTESHDTGAIQGRTSKKKKGKKTRGAKKKRSRKRYTTISLPINDEDTCNQPRASASSRKTSDPIGRLSQGVADLDMNFDSPNEYGSNSSQSSSDSDSVQTEHQDNTEIENTDPVGEALEQEGWNRVSHKKRNKSHNLKSTLNLQQRAVPSTERTRTIANQQSNRNTHRELKA